MTEGNNKTIKQGTWEQNRAVWFSPDIKVGIVLFLYSKYQLVEKKQRETLSTNCVYTVLNIKILSVGVQVSQERTRLVPNTNQNRGQKSFEYFSS